MSKSIVKESFKRELFDLLDETFNKVQGIYLDKGTSLFETLETISAEEASRPVTTKCASIAAQVEHVRFYLQVLGDCIEGKPEEKVDWEESWQKKEVTSEEWEELKSQLRAMYQHVYELMDGVEKWEGEDDIGASFAILAHTAYHLGEIRQALCFVK